MNSKEINTLLDRCEHVPTLILYDNLYAFEKTKESEINEMTSVVEEKLANPLDIALESLLGFQCERLSCDKFGFDTEKIVINEQIMKQALKDIQIAFANNRKELIKLHDLWLNRLKLFLTKLCRANKNISTDEAIYLVSDHFRISTISAIRAIASISK